MAILMLLEIIAPSLHSLAEEEQVYDYTIQALDEKKRDKSISLSMKHAGLFEKIEPKNDSSILVNLETKTNKKDIKLIVRNNLALFKLSTFSSFDLAKKEYKAVKDYYAGQGLDIDISIEKEDGKYRLHNNYKDTYEKGLYGPNYEAFHFTVNKDFDFAKKGLQNKVEGKTKPERLYVFDLQIYNHANESLNMISLQDNKKDPIKVLHDGDIMGALVDDETYNTYKAKTLSGDLRTYYANKLLEEKRALLNKNSQAKVGKDTIDSQNQNPPSLGNLLRPLRAGSGFANKKFNLKTSIKALASPLWSIPKGWYFDVNIGPYLTVDANNPIKDLKVNGKVVANGEYREAENVIRYTFNQSVDTTTDIPIEQILAFNTQAIGNQDPIKLQISIRPKNYNIQYMPVITVKADDPRDIIDSSTVEGSGTVSTDYPYLLSYLYTTKVMSDGRAVPYFDPRNAPNNMEVWWDFEIDGSPLFVKNLDFNQLNIAMYGSSKQGLENFKWGIARSKQGLEDTSIYKSSGSLGEIDQAYSFVSKDYVRTSVGKKIYIRIKARVKPNHYHQDYSIGLRINPDANYVKKIIDEFKAKLQEVQKKFPFLVGYIKGIEGADKFATVPFNLVDGMFPARTVLYSKDYDEVYHHDASRTIIGDRLSHVRSDWYALDLIRLGEEEDAGLLGPNFNPGLRGNFEKWYYVPRTDGTYMRSRDKSDAMMNGQLLPGTIISYKYLNQVGSEWAPYKYDVKIKEKGVDLANVYNDGQKEGGYIKLYNVKSRTNNGVDLVKDYISYIESPYGLIRINRNFDLVQCYNQNLAAPVYGNNNKNAIALDRIVDPSGEFLISRLTKGSDNNLVRRVEPGGSLNQGNRTRSEAIKSLYKRIYYYAEVVNRNYAKDHDGKELHRFIYGDMIQRVLHYFTDEASISHSYGGNIVQNDPSQMQNQTLTGSYNSDRSPKGDHYKGTDRLDRHNFDGYRKLADNESVIDHRYPTINEDQETYARKLLTLVENSYRAGSDWKTENENTVELTFYRHATSGSYQELINGKVTDPIDFEKVAEIGGTEVNLAGATFTFTNRSNGEKVTWTSKKDNTNNPIHLGVGTYLVEETVAPPGYGKLKSFDIKVSLEEINPDHGPFDHYFLPDIHVNDGYQTKVRLVNPPKDINDKPLVSLVEEKYMKNGEPTNIIAKLRLKAKNIPYDLGELNFEKMTSLKNFKLSGAEFTLTKLKANNSTEAENAAANKTFEIIDGTYVYRKTSSGYYGAFKFEQMPLGFYLLEETKAPTGYKKLEAKIVEVKKEANGDVKTYFLDPTVLDGEKNIVVNEPLKTQVKFRKIDQKDLNNTGDYPGLEGAKFLLTAIRVVDYTGTNIDVTTSATEKRKNDQGVEASVNGGYFEFKDLKQGEYELVETRPPKGYFKPNFYGWKLFVFQKPGVKELDYRVFKLQTEADKTLSISDLEKRPGAEIKISEVLKDGKRESAFLLDNTPHTVEWKFAKYVENPNYDPKLPDSATNQKHLKISGDALKDKEGNPLEFYLYRADYYAHKISDTPVATIKPDANGDYRIKNLRYGGNYILEEKNPPKGLLKADPIFLKVESQTVDGVEEYVVNIRDLNNNILANHKQFKGVLDFREGDILGKFKIKKTGKSLWPADNGAEVGLRRAYFRLYKADENFNINKYDYIQKETEGEALTDNKGNPTDTSKLPANQGIAEFTQLKPGKYVLVEYRGPAGYEKDADPWYIVVDETGKVSKFRDIHSYTPTSVKSFFRSVLRNFYRAVRKQETLTFDNDISVITVNAGPVNEEEGTRDLTVNVKPKEVVKEIRTPKKMHMILMVDRAKVLDQNRQDVSEEWDDNVNKFLTDLYKKASKEGTDVDISLIRYSNSSSRDFTDYVGTFNLKQVAGRSARYNYTEYDKNGAQVGREQIFLFTDSMGLGRSFTSEDQGTRILNTKIKSFLSSIEADLNKQYDTKLAVNFVRYKLFAGDKLQRVGGNAPLKLVADSMEAKGYKTWTYHMNPVEYFWDTNKFYQNGLDSINAMPGHHIESWYPGENNMYKVGLAPYVQKDFLNKILTNDDYFVKKETTLGQSLNNANLNIRLRSNIDMIDFNGQPNQNTAQKNFTKDKISGEVTVTYKVKLADNQLFDRDYPIHELISINQSGGRYIHSGERLDSLLIRRKSPESTTINISFDPNGGSGSMAPVTRGKNSEYTLPENGFVPPEGMKFAGWAVGGVKKQPGETVHTGTQDLIIKATWVKDEGGGGVVPVGEGTISINLTYKSNTPMPEGLVGSLKLQVKENGQWVYAKDVNQKDISKEVEARDTFNITKLDPDKEYRVEYNLYDQYASKWIQTDTTYYLANLKASKDKNIKIEIINGDMLTIFNKDENGYRIPLRVSKIDAKDKIHPGEDQDKQKLLPGDTKFQARKLIDGEGHDKNGNPPKYADEPFDTVSEATGEPGDNYFRELTPGIYELWEIQTPNKNYRFPTDSKGNRMKWYFKVEVNPDKVPSDADYMKLVFNFEHTFSANDKFNKALTEDYKKELIARGTIKGPGTGDKDFNRFIEIVPDTGRSHPARPDAPYQGIDDLQVSNYNKTTELKFKKADIVTNERLEGIRFRLAKIEVDDKGNPKYTADGNYILSKIKNPNNESQLISEYDETHESLKFKDLTFDNIPEGSYILEELNTIEGYKRLENPILLKFTYDDKGAWKQEVRVRDGDTWRPASDKDNFLAFDKNNKLSAVKNTKSSTNFRFKKINYNGTPLRYKKFRIISVDKAGNPTGDYDYEKESLTSNEFFFDNLVEGRYKMIETEHGQSQKPTPWFFKVVADKDGKLTIVFENDLPNGLESPDLADQSIRKEDGFTVVNYDKTELIFKKFGLDSTGEHPLRDISFTLKKVRTEAGVNGKALYDEQGKLVEDLKEHEYQRRFTSYDDGFVNFRDLSQGVYELIEENPKSYINDPTKTQTRWILVVKRGEKSLEVKYDRDYENYYYKTYDPEYFEKTYKPYNYKGETFVKERANFTLTDDGFKLRNIKDNVSLRWYKTEADSGEIIDLPAQFMVYIMSKDPRDLNAAKKENTEFGSFSMNNDKGIFEKDGLERGIYRIHETVPPAGYREFEGRDIVIQVIEKGLFENPGKNLEDLSVEERQLIVNFYELEINETPQGLEYKMIEDPSQFKYLKAKEKEGQGSKYKYEMDFTPDNYFSIKNYPIVKLVINKKNDETKMPLEGAEFNLTKIVKNQVNNSWETDLDAKGKPVYKENLRTGEDGRIEFTGLVPGTYELIETKSPLGYETSADTWVVKVSNDYKVTVNKIKKNPDGEVDLQNPENFIFTYRQNGATYELLEVYAKLSRIGGTGSYYLDIGYRGRNNWQGSYDMQLVFNKNLFNVSGIDGTDLDSITKKNVSYHFSNAYSTERFVVTPKSNSQFGSPILAWKYGKGLVYEVRQDHLPIVAPRKIEVGDSVEVSVENEKNTIDIFNKEKPTDRDFKITKRDGSSIDKATLEGVQYELRNDEGKLIKNNGLDYWTTDEKGEIHFEKLTPGRYWLKEVKAKEGYILDPVPIPIFLGDNWAVPDNPDNPTDVSDDISLDTSKENTIKSTEQHEGIIYPNKSQGFISTLHFKINKAAKAGDTFVLSLGNKIDFDGIGRSFDNDFDIVGPSGRIAKATINEDRRSITYTFTNYVEEKTVTEFKINVPFFTNKGETYNNEFTDISIGIAHKADQTGMLTKNFYIDFENYISEDVDVKTLVTKYAPSNVFEPNDPSMDLTAVSYVNPFGEFNRSRYFKFSTNLPMTQAKVSVYRVPYEYRPLQKIANGILENRETRMPWSYGAVDYSKLDFVRTFNVANTDEISMYLGSNLGNDNSSYVVKVEGKTNGKNVQFTSNSKFIRGEYKDDGNWYESNDYWTTFNRYFYPDAGAVGNADLSLLNFKNKISYTKVDLQAYYNAGPKQDGTGTESPKYTIEGAEFELRKLDDSGKYLKVEGSETNSDKNGIFSWEGLRPGKYQVWETKAPDGYVTPKSYVSSFEVNKASEIVNVLNNSTIIKNEKNPLYFYLNKTDTENVSIKRGKLVLELQAPTKPDGTREKFPLGLDKQVGQPYEISYADQTRESIYITIDLAKKDIYEEVTRGKMGIKINIPYDFPDGTYILREKSAPYGYNKSNKDFLINVSKADKRIVYHEEGKPDVNLYKLRRDGQVDLANMGILQIVNEKALFPSTGGLGILAFTILGFVIMLGAVGLQREKDSEEKKNLSE